MRLGLFMDIAVQMGEDNLGATGASNGCRRELGASAIVSYESSVDRSGEEFGFIFNLYMSPVFGQLQLRNCPKTGDDV